ncbi:hypothetical protein NVP1023O_21 [Vibrio phage 1.023.O._10N.222.51.B4]|nr:hypothetical protein NVP1023O_21 [Vibrio phage 1.023.O._10N.222.51.B4]
MNIADDWVLLVEAKLVHLCGSFDDTYYGPFFDVDKAASFIEAHLEYDERCTQIVVVRHNELHHHKPVNPDDAPSTLR